MGWWRLSFIQVRLGSLRPGGRGLFTTAASFPLPAILFPALPWLLIPSASQKVDFLSFLVRFSERSLLGANMIISVTDNKMLLSLVKFLVTNYFF